MPDKVKPLEVKPIKGIEGTIAVDQYGVRRKKEAKEAVEGFAKKGKVEAFVCGTAKMLEEKAKTDFKNLKKGIKDAPSEIKEKVKNIDPAVAQMAAGGAILMGSIVAATVYGTSSGAVLNASETLIAGGIISGGALFTEACLNTARYKPALLERLVKAPKDVKNFVNKAMEKGGR